MNRAMLSMMNMGAMKSEQGEVKERTEKSV